MTFRILAAVLLAAVAAACDVPEPEAEPAAEVGPVPARLSETGLDLERLSFSPQYPLWTDGADKRRFIHLPEGTHVDASDPDDWRFPIGTRLWKEFSFGGRRVETRYMELLPSGEWRYATYVWLRDESDAVLASEDTAETVDVADGGQHVVPSGADCRACHEGRPSPVLAFSLLQLSSDRDPLAPHAAHRPGDVTLDDLIASGHVRGLPAHLAAPPPRIAARTPIERAARGYLHGNCGGCHNAEGPLAPLGLVLAIPANATLADEALATAVGHSSRFRVTGVPDVTLRIAPGDAARSVLARRIRSRDPNQQMPPIGSLVVDDDAARLIEQWINQMETDR